VVGARGERHLTDGGAGAHVAGSGVRAPSTALPRLIR
jgi:hypothetical protein